MVRAKPLQLVLFDAESVSKYIDNYSMVINVKHGSELQVHEASISRSYDIVVNADDGCLGRVVLSID